MIFQNEPKKKKKTICLISLWLFKKTKNKKQKTVTSYHEGQVPASVQFEWQRRPFQFIQNSTICIKIAMFVHIVEKHVEK